MAAWSAGSFLGRPRSSRTLWQASPRPARQRAHPVCRGPHERQCGRARGPPCHGDGGRWAASQGDTPSSTWHAAALPCQKPARQPPLWPAWRSPSWRGWRQRWWLQALQGSRSWRESSEPHRSSWRSGSKTGHARTSTRLRRRLWKYGFAAGRLNHVTAASTAAKSGADRRSRVANCEGDVPVGAARVACNADFIVSFIAVIQSRSGRPPLMVLAHAPRYTFNVSMSLFIVLQCTWRAYVHQPLFRNTPCTEDGAAGAIRLLPRYQIALVQIILHTPRPYRKSLSCGGEQESLSMKRQAGFGQTHRSDEGRGGRRLRCTGKGVRIAKGSEGEACQGARRVRKRSRLPHPASDRSSRRGAANGGGSHGDNSSTTIAIFSCVLGGANGGLCSGGSSGGGIPDDDEGGEGGGENWSSILGILFFKEGRSSSSAGANSTIIGAAPVGMSKAAKAGRCRHRQPRDESLSGHSTRPVARHYAPSGRDTPRRIEGIAVGAQVCLLPPCRRPFTLSQYQPWKAYAQQVLSSSWAAVGAAGAHRLLHRHPLALSRPFQPLSLPTPPPYSKLIKSTARLAGAATVQLAACSLVPCGGPWGADSEVVSFSAAIRSRGWRPPGTAADVLIYVYAYHALACRVLHGRPHHFCGARAAPLRNGAPLVGADRRLASKGWQMLSAPRVVRRIAASRVLRGRPRHKCGVSAPSCFLCGIACNTPRSPRCFTVSGSPCRSLCRCDAAARGARAAPRSVGQALGSSRGRAKPIRSTAEANAGQPTSRVRFARAAAGDSEVHPLADCQTAACAEVVLLLPSVLAPRRLGSSMRHVKLRPARRRHTPQVQAMASPGGTATCNLRLGSRRCECASSVLPADATLARGLAAQLHQASAGTPGEPTLRVRFARADGGVEARCPLADRECELRA